MGKVIKTKKLKKIILFLILILGLKLFDLNIVSSTIGNGMTILSFMVVLLGLLFKKQSGVVYRYSKLIYIFFLGIFLNVIIMLLYNGSSLYDTFFVLINYLGLLLYYFLHKYKYEEKTIFTIIVYIAVIVSLLMIWQNIIKPKPLFNQLIDHPWYLDQRGTVRVRIPGMALVVFTYFYFLNKFLNNNKLKYILFSMFFLAVLVLQGFRSITLTIILCSAYLYWNGGKGKSKITAKKIFLLFFILISIFIVATQVEYIRNIINEMIFQSIEDKEIGDENVRLYAFIYYLDTIKTEFWMYFTGTGLKIPFETPPGLYAVDLGLFGFFALAGVIPTYALIRLLLKSYKEANNLNYLIVTVFYIYILLNCLMFNAEPFRTGIFHIYSLGFYLIDLNFFKQNNLKYGSKRS